MTYIESKIFCDNVVHDLVCWKRRVDDVIDVLKRKTDLNAMLCKLNNIHPITQFIYECETNDFIHIMALKVIRRFNYLQTRT